MNNFTYKKLRATIILAQDSTTVFTTGGKNTLIIDQLRMSATVIANARQASQLSLNIWGMLEADMNALTVAWLSSGAIRNNMIQLEADNGDGYRLVFTGTIIEAQPDFRRVPEVSFQILAMYGYFQSINIAKPLSFSGTVGIDVFGNYFADALQLSYENFGAQATLTNPAYAGTVFDQLRDVARDANIDFYFQGEKLIFTPSQKLLNQIPAVVLSPSSGLIGYPMYTRRGLVISAIYDPAFQCASALEIKDSQVKGANGRWYPFSMEFTLTSNMPGGQWNAVLQCNQAGV